ncbi:hypothetical protein QZH46_09535 [Pseudomonas corrugata]
MTLSAAIVAWLVTPIKPAKRMATALFFNTIFTPSLLCLLSGLVCARLSGAIGPSGFAGPCQGLDGCAFPAGRTWLKRSVYGISYYGIPNFLQAFCRTGHLSKADFSFDFFEAATDPMGASLLAIAVVQSLQSRMSGIYREQARSHRVSV